MIEEKQDTKPITKPPSKWKAWWWYNFTTQDAIIAECPICGVETVLVGSGVIDSCCTFFPCKDTAETWGREKVCTCEKCFGKLGFEAALPEGESP